MACGIVVSAAHCTGPGQDYNAMDWLTGMRGKSTTKRYVQESQSANSSMQQWRWSWRIRRRSVASAVQRATGGGLNGNQEERNAQTKHRASSGPWRSVNEPRRGWFRFKSCWSLEAEVGAVLLSLHCPRDAVCFPARQGTDRNEERRNCNSALHWRWMQANIQLAREAKQ